MSYISHSPRPFFWLTKFRNLVLLNELRSQRVPLSKINKKEVRFLNRHDFHQKHTRYIERTGRAVSVQSFLYVRSGHTHLRNTLVGASHSIWPSLAWNRPLTHYELANGSQRGGLRSTMVVAFLSVHSALRRLLTYLLCRVCAFKFIFAPEHTICTLCYTDTRDKRVLHSRNTYISLKL